MAERRLRVGIDAREVVGKPTGVGRYLAALLTEWSADPKRPHDLIAIVPSPPPDALVRSAAGIEWIVEGSRLAGTRWEQTRLPGALRRARADVLFAPAYTAPLRPPCPVTLTIHDLAYFAHPEWFGWREGLRRRWITRTAARRAAAVLTVSEFSATEIVKFLGIPRGRVHVVLHGAPVAADPGGSSVRDPLVLFVGSLFNRRRIPELLAGFAWAAARVPSARLVLVGDNRTRPAVDPMATAGALGLAGRVEWRRYASDEELAALYRKARAFAFLSDYEGFAMTPLEALAYGVPPVLLDTPVSREIHGAARLVSLAPDAIGSALVDLLTDDAAHERARRLAAVQLQRHRWPLAAAMTMAVIEQAARAGRP